MSVTNIYDQAITKTVSNDFVQQVFEFNEKVLDIGQREKGLLSDKELDYAIKAGVEELMEFEEAHKSQDFIAAVDAVIDGMYFYIGFLKRMGLTAEQVSACMTAVHQANMEKKLGVVEKRGGLGVADAVKPAGWVGPEERIAKVLGD